MDNMGTMGTTLKSIIQKGDWMVSVDAYLLIIMMSQKRKFLKIIVVEQCPLEIREVVETSDGTVEKSGYQSHHISG